MLIHIEKSDHKEEKLEMIKNGKSPYHICVTAWSLFQTEFLFFRGRVTDRDKTANAIIRDNKLI